MAKIYSAIKPKKLIILGAGLGLMALSLLVAYFIYYQDKFYPYVYINQQAVGGLTITQAQQLLLRETENHQINWQSDQFVLQNDTASVSAQLSELDVTPDINLALETAWQGSRDLFDFTPKQYEVPLKFDLVKIKVLLEALKEQSDDLGQPIAYVYRSGALEVNQGVVDHILPIEENLLLVAQHLENLHLSSAQRSDLNLQTIQHSTITPLSEQEVEQALQRGQQFLKAKLTLKFDYQSVILPTQQLLDFVNPRSGFNEQEIDRYLQQLANERINRPSRDAVFRYDDKTLEVLEFQTDLDGLELDIQASQSTIEQFLQQVENANADANEQVIELPLRSAPAAVQIKDTNNLGINEVIGFGESWYDHSIPNRIYNVDVATKRISQHIVAPQVEFSFNKTLGEVSSAAGYRDAYIIEGGMTKLSAGGGVCQVSSTLFRTLLDAGVKITRRLPHAYRVSYYEIGNEPGFDATVYSGNVDLRFVNDTPAHILIECQSDAQSLHMYCKLYGTSDGRSNEIIKYRKWAQVPALATVYIPDPSLRKGQLKQIDWSASGIKAEFTNVIRDKDGQVLREDYYYSNYRPWAAKYLQGI
jgi:vancomycin resistance protein YoaR